MTEEHLSRLCSAGQFAADAGLAPLQGLSLLLATLALALQGCASQPPPPPAWPQLALSEQLNPVRRCLSLALDLQIGLSFKLLGQASDEEVRRDLTEGALNPQAEQRRGELADAWASSHDPARLAQIQLQQCLAAQGQVLPSAPTLAPTLASSDSQRCFSRSHLAAQAEVHKALGRSLAEATQIAQRGIGLSRPPAEVQQIVEAVYSLDRERSEQLAHRRLFVRCMEAAPRS